MSSPNAIFPRWQKLISNEIWPAFVASHDTDATFVTNLTRATTLVCDPHIQTMPQLARDFGGTVDLATPPAEYNTSVGNVDEEYTSYMVYNYAVQQALDTIGTFRPYLIFGEATGKMVLMSDPNNPIAGTVPKPAVEIAPILVSLMSGILIR